MDMELWVFGTVAFVVLSAIVFFASMFMIRETPFEEAVLRQRNQQGLDLAFDTSGKGRSKDKKEKKKDVVKRKDAKVVKSKSEDGVKKTDEAPTQPIITSEPTPPPELPASRDSKKPDHVEFKVTSEVITLNEEEKELLSQRRVSRDDRPRKPIIKKNTASPAGELHETLDSKVIRGNSFENVHPKDEFELIKSREKIRLNGDHSSVDGFVNGHDDAPLAETISSGPVSTPTKAASKKHKPQKASASPVDGITTSKQLIETVKNLALSEDELQLVVNVLLSKDSDGSDWSSKNDPIANLKKQLADKEQALQVESNNLESARARLRELRQEMATEKSRNSSVRENAERLRAEVQRQQLVIQQLSERHEVEVKSLQSTLQSKLADERNLVLARDEIKRLKDIIKKLEADRSSLDSIPRLNHEIEQLRLERQQAERTISSLKSSNDDQQRRIQMLDEHLKKLVADRQADELAREQQVHELQLQLQSLESKRQSLTDELNALRASKKEEEDGRKTQNDLKVKQLEGQIQLLNSEKEHLQSSQAQRDSESSRQLQELSKRIEELQGASNAKEETICQLQKDLESEKRSRVDNDSGVGAKLQAVEKEVQRLSHENSTLEKRVSELRQESENLVGEKQEVLSLLQPLELECEQNNIVSLVRTLVARPAKNVVSSDLENENRLLTEQVEQFKSSLSQTDEALKVIERKADDEHKSWERKLNDMAAEKQVVENDRNRLAAEKKVLENTLKDLEGLRSTVAEMEEKLRDLQTKLESEELTKKDLSSKFQEVRNDPEVSTSLSTAQGQLDEKNQELERINEERQKLEQLKEELEQSKEQIEKEKKAIKEVQVTNVRLKSLVKIGEDSLKAEQERVRSLEELLKVKNGSVVGHATSNGDEDSSTLINDSAS